MRVEVFGEELKFHGQLPHWRGTIHDHYIEIRFKDASGESATWEGVVHGPGPNRMVILSVKRMGPVECAKAIEEHAILIARFVNDCGIDVDPSGGRG